MAGILWAWDPIGWEGPFAGWTLGSVPITAFPGWGTFSPTPFGWAFPTVLGVSPRFWGSDISLRPSFRACLGGRPEVGLLFALQQEFVAQPQFKLGCLPGSQRGGKPGKAPTFLQGGGSLQHLLSTRGALFTENRPPIIWPSPKQGLSTTCATFHTHGSASPS